MDKVTGQCPQTTTFLKRKESRSGIEPRSFRLPAKCLTARPNRLTFEAVPLVEFMYLLFTRMPGESCRRRFRSLSLYSCDVIRVLITSLVCWFRIAIAKFVCFGFFVCFGLVLFPTSFDISKTGFSLRCYAFSRTTTGENTIQNFKVRNGVGSLIRK